MLESKFYIGQIVHHARFNYRGVVVGVDPVFSNTEEWYQQMAVTLPPKDRPWYNVLVDRTPYVTYVAERNLEQSQHTGQIDHAALGDYFKSYDGNRYYMKETTN